MNLLEIRTLFVKQTGRYDLVTSATTFTNNESGFGGGANVYIQQGQKMLDRRLAYYNEEADIAITLATSAWTASIDGVRAVRAIGLSDAQDDEMVYLKRSSIERLRRAYGDENSSLSGVTTGQPAFWALGFLRTTQVSTPTTAALSPQLIFMPPADRTYTLQAQVLLESSSLSADSSVSFWSVNFPQLLVWAAMWALETSYRNEQGARAILSQINEMLEDIDNDIVEQEIVENSVSQSNWRFINAPSRGIDRHVQ